MADLDYTYSEDTVSQVLRTYITGLTQLRETAPMPPKTISADHIPQVFFLPGRATYRKGNGANYWITDRVYRCFLVAAVATLDNDFQAALTAASLLAVVKHKWMAIERLEYGDGKSFNVTPVGDGGITPRKQGDVYQYVIEFSLSVSYEERVMNTGAQ